MSSYVALIPAAGTGTRMGDERPKQYLPLLGRPMLFHVIERLSADARIRAVYVVLSAGDRWFDGHDWSGFGTRLKALRCGGASRAASVLNGLDALKSEVGPNDWVLVHDAARPCLSAALLSRLIGEVGEDEAGGLLAIPVADTLKRAVDGRVAATEPRGGLWQAQTPQMFRHGLLSRALRTADQADVTDESSAVEKLGLKPRLVASDLTNLKVTFPQDLVLAELILASGALAA
jgi:2-C-methyl-D-erythritol 4-phosphate cytidylyltransferase